MALEQAETCHGRAHFGCLHARRRRGAIAGTTIGPALATPWVASARPKRAQGVCLVGEVDERNEAGTEIVQEAL